MKPPQVRDMMPRMPSFSAQASAGQVRAPLPSSPKAAATAAGPASGDIEDEGRGGGRTPMQEKRPSFEYIARRRAQLSGTAEARH